METTEERIEGTLVIALSGRLDANSAEAFEQQLLGSIASGEASILLDLAALEYVSSAGLRVLLVGARRLQEKAGKLGACAPRGEVLDVLQMTGFDNFVAVHPDRETALSELA